MEPRPPFHNNNNNRYAPIPPPRFSDHRNFHHHHHHHRLPPPQPAPPHPRPPPPPVPPYRLLPQFPYPFEENPRRHDALDLHRHPPPPTLPRLCDQPVFDHPPRLRQHPNFNNNSYVDASPEVFDPPRVPADDRQLRPFPIDWEIESNHHHHHRQHHHHRRCHNHNHQHQHQPDHQLKQPLMSPYRDVLVGGFVERKRFGEDSEGRLISFRECPRESFERNQKEELFWSPIDRRGDSGNENCVRRHVVVVDHHDASESGYDFEYDVVGEERRRDPTRPPLVSHHSVVMEYENVVSDDVGPSDDGRHVFSGKRFHHQMKTGKFKDIVDGEGSDEVICTPKKKIQRMSALLRVQLGNPGKKWKDEGSMLPGYANTKKWKDGGSFASSGYFDNRNAGLSKAKEEVREGSPVELDVSFKSNALVAKAITNPSSPIVGCDGASTPNGKKRKVMPSVVGLGSPKVSEIREGKINGDNSTHSMDSKPNLDRGVMSLKEKVTVGGISAVDVAVTKPTLNNMNVPHGNKKVAKSSASKMTGSGPTVKKKKKKKMVPMPGTGLQKSQVTKVSEGVVNGSSSICGENATLNPKKCLTKSKGKISANTIRTVDNVGLQASQTAGALPRKSRAVGASPSGLVSDYNGISASKVRQSDATAAISSLPSTSVTGNLGGTFNVTGCNPCVDTALDSNNGPINIEMGVTESGIGKKNDVDLQPLHEVTVPLENCAIAGSLSSPIVSSGTPNTQIKDVFEEAVNADGSTHGANAASSSEKVPRKTDEEEGALAGNRMTKGACLQSIDKTNVKMKNDVGVESLSRSVVQSPAVPNVNRRKKKKKNKQNNKKKVLDDPSSLSSSTVKAIVEGPVNSHVSVPVVLSVVSSDTDVMQSDEKVAAPMIEKTGDVDPNSLDGVTVSLNNNEEGQSFLSPVSGSDDTPNDNNSNEAADALTGLPNSRLTEICDGTVCAGGSSSDRCMMLSGDKVTASETDMTRTSDFQPLHRTAVSTASNATAELLPNPVVDYNDTPEIKKQDFMECFGLTSIVSEIYDHGMDSAITSQKDFTLSNKKSSSQPLPTIPSLLENSAVEQSLLDFNLGSDQKYIPKVTRKDDTLTSILCLSNSQSTTIHDEPIKANSCDFGTSAGSSSRACLMQLEEKAKVSGIDSQGDVSLQPANLFSLYLENSAEEGSSMFTFLGKDGLNQEDVRNSANQSKDSNSSVGELAFPILNSPFLSPGLKGGWRKNFTSIVTGGKSKENTLHNDRVELENDREREEKLMMEKEREKRTFNGEKCDNIGLHQQAEVNLGFLPLEAPKLLEDERSLSKPLENDGYGPPSQDELPTTSLNIEVSGALLHNSSDEVIEFLPDKCTNLGDQESLSKSSESDTLNSEQLHNLLLGEKMSCKEDGPDEKPVDKRDSVLNAKLSTSDSDTNVKIHEAIKIGGLFPEKPQPLPPQESGKSSPFLKTKFGEFTGRNTHQIPQVPRVLPGRSIFTSGFSKEPAALTRITRPRTWRRTDNATLPQRDSFLSTGTSQSNLQNKFGKTQSNSYIRKGNSLVRKSAPSAILPHGQPRLDPIGRLESKRDDVTEITSSSIDPSLILGLEMSRAPPLPENSGSPNDTTNSSQVYASYTSADPLLKVGLEITPAPVVTESNIVPKISGASDFQSGVIKDLGTDNVLNSGKLKSPKARKVIYVKHKSNQLVASRNTKIGNSLLSVSENSRALFSSSSSDQYYKRRKNQLIRSSPSLGSHLKQAVTVPDDGSNSESQIVPKVSYMKCSKNISKRRTNKVLVKRCRPSKFSLVWTLNGQKTQGGAAKSLQYQNVLPHLFPWKRTVHWRNVMSNSMSVSKKTSMSMISKKLLLSRKRDTVYTRSAGGYSLRKSKVLSIGGSNLKWSKSIEKRSKKVNEEATRAVAAVQRKKREQKGVACAVSSEKNINHSSRERIFRIGSVRYKMDSSRRTLQRILDEKSSCSADLKSESGKDGKKSFIPKRLLIGNDEYIRIGNGNQLVRDPKKLVRFLASEKVRWSLHTARMRVAKKQQYCQFFTRFGKCKKAGGKCPYIHDPAKVAVCTKFLKGLCSNSDCKLTHEIIPERMQDCSYFLQGLCSNENCPYRHVNVNPSASVCEGFLRGYCADGNECREKHTYVCPIFESTGICPQGSSCKLHHPKPKNKSKKRKRSKDPKKSSGRYFGSRLSDVSGATAVASDKANGQKSEDIFVNGGRFTDYISLDISMEEAEEDLTNNPTASDPKLCESDPSDLQTDELDELIIKPIRIMKQGKL